MSRATRRASVASYVSSKRINKYNASLLLSGEGDLVAVDADKAEVL